MKTPAAVVAAQEAVKAKAAELTAAKEVVKRLEAEWSAALQAVREAQINADAALPQCRLVSVHWRSQANEDRGRVVIVKRTPSGILVTRPVGMASGCEYRFKWNPYSGAFTQAEKSSSWTSDHRELRDVPPEFMPKVNEAAVTA